MEKWGINQETLNAVASKDRQMGLVEIAEASAAGFGNPSELISESEIKKYLDDPVLSIVYAELGRIAVDANKTLANQSLNPRTVYRHLDISGNILQATTLNSDFQKSPNIINAPNAGKQDFLAEGKRDHLKTIDAAVPLYPDYRGSFYIAGDRILRDLYSRLPDGHATKPLVAIEIQLRNEAFDMPVDRDAVMQNYRELIEYTMVKNPDRAATVSAWLIGLGQRTKDFEMEKLAFSNFSLLLKQNRTYREMTNKEKLREYKKWRDFAVNLTSSVIPKSDKSNLRQKLQV